MLGIDPQHRISVGMVVPACNPSSQKDRKSRELEGSLSYKKPYFFFFLKGPTPIGSSLHHAVILTLSTKFAYKSSMERMDVFTQENINLSG